MGISRVLPPDVVDSYINRYTYLSFNPPIYVFALHKPFLEHTVRLRLVDGDVIHISTALMQILLEDESIGRFKRCSNQVGGGYSHSTSSSDRQARLNTIVVEYKLYHEDEAMET